MPFALDAIYTEIAALAAPFIAARMAFSERWRAGLAQRLGFLEPRHGDQPCLWIHCASVGETLNVKSFVERAREALPDWQFVVSVNTNTGMAVAQKRYADLRAFYYPLDLSWTVARTMRRIRPDCVVLFELEAWPHFLLEAARRNVPVVVINGRVNPVTVKAHRLLRLVAGEFWQRCPLNAYGVQTDDYAKRFGQLGIPDHQIQVTGQLKFDNIELEPDPEAKRHLEQLFDIDPRDAILVGGSTWDGEEQALLDAFAALRRETENLRLVLVPRHIERADSVAGLVRSAGHVVVRKTALDAGQAPPGPLREAVLLVDTVGDLATVFALASVAFVGKSLVPLGGQNMLEPAGLGRAVVFGPHTSNFEKETELLLDNDAAACVSNTAELIAVSRDLLQSPKRAAAMGRRAQQVVLANKGAAKRSVAMVMDVLRRKESKQ